MSPWLRRKWRLIHIEGMVMILYHCQLINFLRDIAWCQTCSFTKPLRNMFLDNLETLFRVVKSKVICIQFESSESRCFLCQPSWISLWKWNLLVLSCFESWKILLAFLCHGVNTSMDEGVTLPVSKSKLGCCRIWISSDTHPLKLINPDFEASNAFDHAVHPMWHLPDREGGVAAQCINTRVSWNCLSISSEQAWKE